MNGTETFTGLEVVTKMIADMICGPAIIVMARGRISRFILFSFRCTVSMSADYHLTCHR